MNMHGKPFEVHYRFAGEPMVETFSTEEAMNSRARRIMQDSKRRWPEVQTFRRTLTPIRMEIADIAAVAAVRHGTDVKSMFGAHKLPHLVRARDETFYWCSKQGYLDRDTAAFFGVARETVSVGVARHTVRAQLPEIEGRVERSRRPRLMSKAAKEHSAVRIRLWASTQANEALERGVDVATVLRAAGRRTMAPQQQWWKEEGREALLKRLWLEGVPTSEIGSALGGRTVQAVLAKASRMKLPKRGEMPLLLAAE